MNKLIRAGIMIMPIELIGLPSNANKSLLETCFQPINVKDICKSLIKHFSNCENAFYSLASRYWFLNFFFFCLCRVACGILVPQPGIEPTPHAVEVWSLNHWTTREAPDISVYNGWELGFGCFKMTVILGLKSNILFINVADKFKIFYFCIQNILIANLS